MDEKPDTDAIFVIDLQNGFLSSPTRALPKKIARFLSRITPAHLLFFQFKNKPGSKFEKSLGWKRMRSKKETALAQEVRHYAKTIFTHDSYSLFNAQTKAWLKRHAIRRIFLCGVYTDVCVLYAALEAFDHGYDPLILKDLVGTQHGQKRNNETLKTLERAIGRNHVIRSDNAKP